MIAIRVQNGTSYDATAALNSEDYATIKYSNAGVPLWTNRYNGPATGADSACGVATDASGNIYVTGSSYDSDSATDYATIKYSNAGVPLWTNRYNGSGNGFDFASAIAVDSSGSVYVTGASYDGASSDDYTTVAYSSTGLPLWTNRYNGPGNFIDRAQAVAVDASGNVYVTGFSHGSDSNYDFVTIKYAQVTTPAITMQPASRAVTPCSAATFAVSAEGVAPLSYQWIKNGTTCLSDGGKVSGATTAALTIANAQKVDEAGYRVLITNTLGAALSDTAMLFVLDSPVQFVNCSVHGGVLFQSQLAVLPGTNVILETRTAATSWTPLATNSAPNGILQFSDPMVFPPPPAEAPTIRFYRARLAP